MTLDSNGTAVTVGMTARLLTEYAPLTIINTSLTDRVYLSGDSNVSPKTGVPLEPSTAYVWLTPGALYAVADPSSAVSGVPLILTGSSNAWQPSPVALGAAIAAQLAAEGIVTRLTLTDLGVWNVPSGGIYNPLYIDTTTRGLPPLTSYGTVLVIVAAAVVASGPLQYAWQTAVAGTVIDGPSTLPLDRFFGGASITMPVISDVLMMQMANLDHAGATVHLYGYNERLSDKPIGSGSSLVGFSALAVINSTAPQTQSFFFEAGEVFEGPAQCYVILNYANSNAIQPMTINIAFNGISTLFQLVRCDTQLASVGNGKAYEGYFQRALPAGPFDLQLRLGFTTGLVDATVRFQAIPL